MIWVISFLNTFFFLTTFGLMNGTPPLRSYSQWLLLEHYFLSYKQSTKELFAFLPSHECVQVFVSLSQCCLVTFDETLAIIFVIKWFYDCIDLVMYHQMAQQLL